MGRKVAVHTNIAGVSHTGHAAHFLVEGVEKPTDNKDSMKPIIRGGFTRSIVACTLTSDSSRGVESHDSMAASN